MSTWQAIAGAIADATGAAFEPHAPDTLGGGCINSAFRLSDGRRDYFVKTNRATLADMFEAEAAGLAAMAETGTLRVPEPVCHGVTGDTAYLVIEYIAPGRRGAESWALAGERLAAMHRHSADRFGWQRDNTIGATPQPNAWHADWTAFWRDRRLGFQLAEAARNGHGGRLQTAGERLRESLPALLDHAPEPSLLHGDLWSGNLAFDADGSPYVYDPATYYGDREADLAMTELFGGFDRDFYAAYTSAWPMPTGYPVRKELYNLYHVLNHLNLFGGGYHGQAMRLMERLLAAC